MGLSGKERQVFQPDASLSEHRTESLWLPLSCFKKMLLFPQNIAECGHMQPRLDTSITLDARKEAACQQNIAYGKSTKFTGKQFHEHGLRDGMRKRRLAIGRFSRWLQGTRVGTEAPFFKAHFPNFGAGPISRQQTVGRKVWSLMGFFKRWGAVTFASTSDAEAQGRS